MNSIHVLPNVTSSTPSNISRHGRDEGLARIEIAVQSVIFCLAVMGNICVLYALTYRKKKTSRMHVFIMHLSIADLMVAIFNILPQLAWDVTYRFQGNDFLCRSIKYMQVVVMYLSTYILVMTAIDRYRAICHPLSNHSTSRRRVGIMIGIAWALSLTLSTPQLVIFQLQEVEPNSAVYDCWAYFYPEWTVKIYIACFTLSVYIIPFYILAILYGRICWEVWKNVRDKKDGQPVHFTEGKVLYKFDGSGTISIISPHLAATRKLKNGTSVCPRVHASRGFSRSKMKTIKLTFVVIIAYVACWSPFFITQMWWAFDENAPYNSSTFVICLLLGSLNSCCNPWIYMAFSGSLIQQLLPCCRKSQPPRFHQKKQAQPKPSSKSDSKSSSTRMCPCRERLLNELNMNHNTKHQGYHYNAQNHHQIYNGILNKKIDSRTTSTKLTGTPSPSYSRKLRYQINKVNGVINYKFDMNQHKPQCKDDLHLRSGANCTYDVCHCQCHVHQFHDVRETNYTTEPCDRVAAYDKFGDISGKVLYDLSTARRHRKYLSQPSLTMSYDARNSNCEHANPRCTTSV